MLTKIQFKNFRSFREQVSLDCKPITIFVGPNNSGKSSLLSLISGMLKNPQEFNIHYPDDAFQRLQDEKISIDLELIPLFQGAYLDHDETTEYKGFQIPGVVSVKKKSAPYDVSVGMRKGWENYKLRSAQDDILIEAQGENGILDITNLNSFPISFELEKGYLRKEFGVESSLINNFFSKIYEVGPFTIAGSVFSADMGETVGLIPKRISLGGSLIDIDKEMLFENVSFNPPGEEDNLRLRSQNFYDVSESLAKNIDEDLFEGANSDKNKRYVEEKLEEFGLAKFGFAKQQGFTLFRHGYKGRMPSPGIDINIRENPPDRDIFGYAEIDKHFLNMAGKLQELERSLQLLPEHWQTEDYVKSVVIWIVLEFYEEIIRPLEALLNERILDVQEFFFPEPPPEEKKLYWQLHRITSNREHSDFYKNFEQKLVKSITDRHLKKQAAKIEERINKYFERFQIGFEFKLVPQENPLGKTDWYYYLKDKKSDMQLTLDEVGAGYSQIIPIIAETIWNDYFYLLEEPEMQLHPKFQSNLAEFFVDELFYENGVPKKQYFIETHSEYLIRKLQVLVANGRLTKDQIAFYYIHQNANGVSNIDKIRIDERGFFLDDWGKGFFDETPSLIDDLWKPRNLN
ncbi:MAG: DUF3696 domain-containing protein [Candidatus Marinimicrobia bacterium]|nr:DUF3696 domain-containing protein [Candidatus Neomarinimicrobiota bacterium]MCF7880187.1 DUF3696 domain-containing protein [Candidatus Neomarinimicrobiota bacterium]